MEHKIINDGMDELNLEFVERNGETILFSSSYLNCCSLELKDEHKEKLAGILMNHLLEKGHFDEAIKGWISANELDGDAFDDCGKTKLTFTPEDLYETIYDCIDGITDV